MGTVSDRTSPGIAALAASRMPPRGRAFPTMAAAPGGDSPAPVRWFVTAHSVESVVSPAGVRQRPTSVAHAKEMGTTQTACGLRATSWPKLFDLAFPARDVESCTVCSRIVTHRP